jgi:hypothetical protein
MLFCTKPAELFGWEENGLETAGNPYIPYRLGCVKATVFVWGRKVKRPYSPNSYREPVLLYGWLADNALSQSNYPP